MKNYRKIYLDDERFPKSPGWIIVRNFKEFKHEILTNGLPDEFSFDHDLGDNEKTGYEIVKWLIDDMNFDIRGIKINVHSANPVGKKNIEMYIKNYIKFIDEYGYPI